MWDRTRMCGLLATALLAIGVAGCDGIVGDHACTLIGCNNALLVELTGTPPADYTVTVENTSGGGTQTIRCSTDSPCPFGGAYFTQFTPATVRVTVRAGDRTRTQEFTPVYTESRPNGRDCEPVCRNGRITFTL